MRSTLSPLPLVVALVACGGAASPPPPVATATPAPAADGLRPLSSRDGAPTPTSAAAPAAPAPLPAGHPPIEGTPPTSPPLPAGHPPLGEPAPGATTLRISGTITLSPRLAVGPSDILYVMAKKGSATLAVRRVEKPTFPYAFEIAGSDTMMSGGPLQGPVDVVARVSRSGDAIPAKGDLEGATRNVKIPAGDVKLTIDSVRP